MLSYGLSWRLVLDFDTFSNFDTVIGSYLVRFYRIDRISKFGLSIDDVTPRFLKWYCPFLVGWYNFSSGSTLGPRQVEVVKLRAVF